MVFVNTKREAEFLHDRLNANGYPCRVISGDVDQKRRNSGYWRGSRRDAAPAAPDRHDVASRGLKSTASPMSSTTTSPRTARITSTESAAPRGRGRRGRQSPWRMRTAPSTWRRSRSISRRRFRWNGPRTTCSSMTTSGRSRNRAFPWPGISSRQAAPRQAAASAPGSLPQPHPVAAACRAAAEGEVKKKRRIRKKKPAGEKPAGTSQ